MSKKMEDRCVAFEKKHGKESFIKAVLSTINKILVDKEVCTQEELEAGLAEVMDYAEKKV